MIDYLALKQPIGPSYNTDPDDVTQTKTALASSGHYQVPEHGISPYPDTPLMDGIKSFQKENNLRIDGVMKPGGETEKTINKQAATVKGDWEGRRFTDGCIPKSGWKTLGRGKAWNPDDRQVYRCMTTKGWEKFVYGPRRWIGMSRFGNY
ncbi:hypothetical protein RYZ26_10780 [Terasakiella sp. A23]|uniref:hypothetical protein n=1 Tax=Terasakiella sp. FCG-A23 TaxID=3080561 RepID=UPI002952EC48|nr:hypothetical protein [Terasakiella sp. A23]MDV7340079.1 hypothetical protein [Terasakiella sp. A23]